MAQLGTLLGETINKERKTLFCLALKDLTEGQLRHGFDEALKFWKQEYGKKFPVPAEIREFAERYQPVDPIAETRRLYLEREAKPANWEPVTEEELQEFRKQLKQAAEARQIPSYNANAERLMRESNGKSEVPSDPVERAPWAREMARKQGWIEGRQPGDDDGM